MSIFPKKITKDEAVIIHVRIKNYDDKIKFLQLRTYIEAPNGKIVKRFNKDFLLNVNSNDNLYKDFYFEFCPHKKDVPGKYLAKTNLYYKGEVLHSSTVDNDYFYIEELEIKKVIIDDDISFCIKNKSFEKTSFNIVFIKDQEKKIINKTLDGLEEHNFKYSNKKHNEVFIEYGNIHCERILHDMSDKIYVRNHKYNWKCIDDELIIYSSKKEIRLNNFLSYIWLSCDGIHTVSEISKDCQISELKIKRVMRKLKNKGLIYLKKD